MSSTKSTFFMHTSLFSTGYSQMPLRTEFQSVAICNMHALPKVHDTLPSKLLLHGCGLSIPT